MTLCDNFLSEDINDVSFLSEDINDVSSCSNANLQIIFKKVTIFS